MMDGEDSEPVADWRKIFEDAYREEQRRIVAEFLESKERRRQDDEAEAWRERNRRNHAFNRIRGLY